MTVRVSIAIFPKNGAFLSFLSIGHPYNRYEFFLKIGSIRIIRVCQVFNKGSLFLNQDILSQQRKDICF